MVRRPLPVFPVHGIIEDDDIRHEPQSEFVIGTVSSFGPREHRAGEPHRHDGFTEVLYVRDGKGTHYIDSEAYPLEAGLLFVVREGQVHHWVAERPLDGMLVLFRNSFLAGEGGPRVAGLSDGACMLRPDETQSRRIEELLAAMSDEDRLADTESPVILRHLLSTLLAYCVRMGGSRAQTSGDRGARAALNREFARFVSQRASAQLTVRQCALELGVSPGHLHEVVMTQTGKAPGQTIRLAVLIESQRLLARTELTCTQVADVLGFDSSSYFSRFFRREAGVTPSEYRRRLAETDGGQQPA